MKFVLALSGILAVPLAGWQGTPAAKPAGRPAVVPPAVRGGGPSAVQKKAPARSDGTHAAELARQALNAREAGRLEESIALYRRALAERPGEAEWWWYQGLNFYDLDRYVEAERAFFELTQLNPKHGGAHALLGLCEIRNKKYETAFAHIVVAKQLGLIPNSELDRVAHLNYIMLANKLGQFELSSALTAQYVRTEAVNLIVEQTAGLAALRMPLMPFEIPERDMEKVLLAGRACVIAWQGLPEKGREQAAALLAAHPGLPNAHYLMGYLELLLEHTETSLQHFKKELEISPDHVQARLQVAYVYMQLGESAKGLPYALEAVKMAPKDFAAHTLVGRVLMDLNRVAEAVPYLETAARLAPTSPDAHFQLAKALDRAGKAREAEKHRDIFRRLREAQQTGATLLPEKSR